MNDLRTAAQQALEALEWFNKYGTEEHGPSLRGAEHALRAALAEPVQEPVAWYHVPYPNNGFSPMVSLSKQHEPSMYGAVVPLYLAPPQRKPLSEEEALDIARTFGAQPWPPGSCVAFARAVERAHGIGEQP